VLGVAQRRQDRSLLNRHQVGDCNDRSRRLATGARGALAGLVRAECARSQAAAAPRARPKRVPPSSGTLCLGHRVPCPPRRRWPRRGQG
jgi:hypothetical protein